MAVQTEGASIREKLRVVSAHLSYWPRTWRVIWTAAPRQTALWALVLLVLGILPALSVYATKLLVDNVVNTAGDSARTVDDLIRTLGLVGVTAGLMLAMEVLQSVLEWIRTAQSELVQDYLKTLIHERSTSVDLSYTESSEYHDLLEQVRTEAAMRPLALLENAGGLVQNSITLVAMMVVLIPYGAWLPVALLLSTLPALFVVVRVDRTYHRWWQRTTTRRRRAQYYDMLLTQAPTAPEVRMFGLGRHFIYLYQQLRERLRKERLHLIQRQTVARVGAGAIGVLISGLTLGWMVLRAALGVASLGDLVLLYQAFQRGQGLMRSLLGSVGQIYTNTLFLGSLFTFLDLQPRLGQASDPASPPARLEHGIRFRNVTFTYPDAVRPALCQFDLTIPANQIVAIVGANGAGKTTLIKLLCRFYDPEQGRIELDGIDIREFAIDELRRRITVLFQIPITYLASFHDSVALGDITAQPTRSDTEAAARGAGAHDLAERLPRGYDTLLGKWFGEGVELSGGEWQRVAMARAYIRRRAPIILLDEPTSFMDSWAEADWFKRFRTLADGRTGLIITHRFTIAMRADIIHVVAQGQIVESGTHHELVTRGGLYAESWTTQMRSAAATVVPDHEVPAGSAA